MIADDRRVSHVHLGRKRNVARRVRDREILAVLRERCKAGDPHDQNQDRELAQEKSETPALNRGNRTSRFALRRTRIMLGKGHCREQVQRSC